MPHLGHLEAGNRHDLHIGISPDAPDEGQLHEEDGAYGYAHSYETSSRFDGPGLRIVLFVSGCLLRCSYCHNPDTWHLKDGTYISAQEVLDRLAKFAPALRALDGGLTISGGEPLVQAAFTRRILAGAKQLGLHTAIETSGYLGDHVDETLVPGFTDDPANVEGIARFVAPMKNVEWVEVQPFHQLGAFKWKAMNLEYKNAQTPTPTPDLIERVIEQFRAAGCRVR